MSALTYCYKEGESAFALIAELHPKGFIDLVATIPKQGVKKIKNVPYSPERKVGYWTFNKDLQDNTEEDAGN